MYPRLLDGWWCISDSTFPLPLSTYNQINQHEKFVDIFHSVSDSCTPSWRAAFKSEMADDEEDESDWTSISISKKPPTTPHHSSPPHQSNSILHHHLLPTRKKNHDRPPPRPYNLPRAKHTQRHSRRKPPLLPHNPLHHIQQRETRHLQRDYLWCKCAAVEVCCYYQPRRTR